MEMYSTLQKSVGDEEPISVYIIEDFEPYRETVQEIINLEEDMFCDFVFESCEDYLGVFQQIPPPMLILMDIAIPGKMNGIEGTRRIRALNPDIKVVMLTNSDSNNKIFDARSSGAVGYIIKDDEPEVLTAKIREAAKGGIAMSTTAARKMQHTLESKFKPRKSVDYGLTRREKEVLSQMVKSKTRREIAATLFISFPTVDTHVQSIYRKLSVNTNVQAVKKAMDEGLVDDEDAG